MDEKSKVFSVAEIARMLSPLFKEKELQLVLLFGSISSGVFHPQSDIDLAFLYEKPVDILDLTNKVIRLLHSDLVDIVDLRRASPLLAFSVAKQGRVLYEKSSGVFNIFYSLAFRRYVDTKKLRQAQARSIKSFLEARRLG